MLEYLLVNSLLPLGYLSGGNWKSGLFSPLIGLVFGLLLSVNWYWLPLFALCGWVAEKPSPAANAIGAITEGRSNYRDYLALAKRGLIYASFYLPLYFVTPQALCLLGMTVMWPLSAFIGTKLPKLTAWQWSETLRYTLVGLTLSQI